MKEEIFKVVLVSTISYLLGRIYMDKAIEAELKKRAKLLKDQNDLIKEQNIAYKELLEMMEALY